MRGLINQRAAAFVLLAVLTVPTAFAQIPSGHPDLVLRHTFTGRDQHGFVTLPFDVPPGTERISVSVAYSKKDEKTALDFGLWGPSGFRGWSGGDKESFTLSQTDATPAYLPGIIEAGRWKLVIGVPNIRLGVIAELRAGIYFDRVADLVLRKGPAWYRGDFHMHTAHSDGTCQSQNGVKVPCPLFKTIDVAARRGLDFIAITDHNTLSHYAQQLELQPYFDRVLLIPGRELTTYEGHANLFGTTKFVDFRLGPKMTPDMNALLREVSKLGGVLSINHPSVPGGENCMGCEWSPGVPVDYRMIQAVEVVNGPDSAGPESGIPFWEKLLSRGYRLTAIGGSDNHEPDIPIPGAGSVGFPTTVVYAADLSLPAILEGLKAGSVFIDMEGTADRVLDVRASVGGETIVASMGGIVDLRAHSLITLHIHVTHVRGGRLVIVVDGKTVESDKVLESDDVTSTIEADATRIRHWIRVDVKDMNGRLLLLGNPIYRVN